ncbi:ATPase subunit of ABC transporter with duplicated ATPase domains [Pseudomonas sp. BS3782 TE3695]|jgi:ATPase subunit of ABC transporter with duplicated ATPase domains|uniref:ABC-F family ATP-binding cassette domain-containing protein n=1 Tax=Pseudomonas sp. BS3782 TE3695 TaxID=3349323 RepID=UPI003D2411D8
MSLIKLENVSLTRNETTLFSELNLNITSGDRLGIVGDNGAGKSSLLRSIAKLLDEHEGTITHARGLRCVYVEQGFADQWNDTTALDILIKCLPDPTAERWKADYTLELFNFPTDYRSLSYAELSGGWKKILMIARAMLSEPDVLLLDEPTNHLDQSHIENLARFLNEGHTISTFAVVSHNRDFLDSTTKSTLFLHNRRASHFKRSFTEARTMLLEQEQALSESRSIVLHEVQRLKKSAQFQRQLGVNNYSDNALQKAKKLEKRVENLQATIPKQPSVRKNNITLAVDEFSAKKILLIEDLRLTSSDGKELLYIQSLTINKGDRIIVTGANGCGKSTLLKTIISNTDPHSRLGPSVKIGILDQEISVLPKESTASDFFSKNFEMEHQQAINTLASAGFSYLDAQKKFSQLSYGERSRLAILAMRLINPNFLILDEPTNHLDITSQEMLENEIQRLNPAAIIVSHDTKFIRNVGNRFFDISNGICKERY